MLGTGGEVDQLVLRVLCVFHESKLRNTLDSYEVQLKYKYCNFDRL